LDGCQPRYRGYGGAAPAGRRFSRDQCLQFDVLDKAMEIISSLPSLEAAVILWTIDSVEDFVLMTYSIQTKTWIYGKLHRTGRYR
jgi:hypothetical protein